MSFAMAVLPGVMSKAALKSSDVATSEAGRDVLDSFLHAISPPLKIALNRSRKSGRALTPATVTSSEGGARLAPSARPVRACTSPRAHGSTPSLGDSPIAKSAM